MSAEVNDSERGSKPRSRRQFLSVCAASSAISTIGVGKALSERKRTIVATRDSSGPVRRESVPKRWFNTEKRAQNVASKLHLKTKANSAVHRIRVVNRDKTIGSHHLPKVLVEKVEGESLNLPELPTEVPIEIREVDYEMKRMSHCYTGEEDPLPGGVHVGSSEGHDKGGTGTGVVIDGNGDVCYMTAYHVINPGSCTGLGHGYHYDNYVGSVHATAPAYDAALIKPSSNNDLNDDLDAPHIFTSDSTPSKHNVRSWYNKAGIGDLRSRDDVVVYKQGIKTGERSGELFSANEPLEHLCVNANSSFVAGFEVVGGDSGGPIYTKNNGDLEILGHTYGNAGGKSGTACGDDKFASTTGLAFYPLHDNYGWSFYTDNLI